MLRVSIGMCVLVLMFSSIGSGQVQRQWHPPGFIDLGTSYEFSVPDRIGYRFNSRGIVFGTNIPLLIQGGRRYLSGTYFYQNRLGLLRLYFKRYNVDTGAAIFVGVYEETGPNVEISGRIAMELSSDLTRFRAITRRQIRSRAAWDAVLRRLTVQRERDWYGAAQTGGENASRRLFVRHGLNTFVHFCNNGGVLSDLRLRTLQRILLGYGAYQLPLERSNADLVSNLIDRIRQSAGRRGSREQREDWKSSILRLTGIED